MEADASYPLTIPARASRAMAIGSMLLLAGSASLILGPRTLLFPWTAVFWMLTLVALIVHAYGWTLLV